MKQYLPLFGRFGITLIFIINGLHKALEFEEATVLLREKGIPFASFLMVITIIIELLGGLSITIGYRVKTISFIMAIYLIITTSIFHPVWFDMFYFKDFVKNTAIIGGLFMLSYFGGGPKSFDTFFD